MKAMSSKLVFCCTGLIVVYAISVFAAPGEVQIGLESSTDEVTWSPATPGTVDVSSTEPFYRATIVPVDGGTVQNTTSVQATTSDPSDLVDVILESSTDLSTWSPQSTGVVDVSGTKLFLQVRTADVVTSEFVTVNGGTFEMAGRQTTVSTFDIKRTEVTKAEWDDVVTWALLNGYDFSGSADGCEASHPIQSVTWYDAVKWCNARSERDGLTPAYYTEGSLTTIYRTGIHVVSSAEVDWSADGYRLPTDAEWEFAARGGNSSSGFSYSGSNTVGDVAWYGSNSTGATCDYNASQGTWPVEQKLANELGIHDMSGNVFEWCWDWFETTLDLGAVTDPKGPPNGSSRILRGGSWFHSAALAEVTFRGGNSPNGGDTAFGFRVVQVPPSGP